MRDAAGTVRGWFADCEPFVVYESESGTVDLIERVRRVEPNGGVWWGDKVHETESLAAMLIALVHHVYGANYCRLTDALVAELALLPESWELPLSWLSAWCRTGGRLRLCGPTPAFA